MTRIGIVGSRRWLDRNAIVEIVASLPPDCIVVSGGAAGPDSWAVAAARRRGLQVREHLPEHPDKHAPRWAFTRAYHARNQSIVDDVDRLIAFVASDRKGGTEDTIKRARRAGKPVELHLPMRSQQDNDMNDLLKQLIETIRHIAEGHAADVPLEAEAAREMARLALDRAGLKRFADEDLLQEEMKL